MSYCIEYSPEDRRRYPLRCKGKKNWYLTVVGIATLVLVMFFGIGSVRERVTGWLLPGDPDVTEEAVIEFITDMRNGNGFYESAQTFCRQIIAPALSDDEKLH